MTTPICAVCQKPFTPYRKTQVYCSHSCKDKAQWQRRGNVEKKQRAEKQGEKTCGRCGVNIAHRGASAQYCERCTRGNARYSVKTAPDRDLAKHNAKVALERLANRGASRDAAKSLRKELHPRIQANIDRVVAKAKANGTCYGTG